MAIVIVFNRYLTLGFPPVSVAIVIKVDLHPEGKER